MSKVKKSLLVLPLLMALLISSFMLTACGKPAELSLSEDLANNANTVVNNIVKNVYNAAVLKGDLGDDGKEKYYYTVSEIQNLIPNAEFYVEVGTFKNIKKLNKITIGGYTFNAGDDIAISVGNGNFIKDDAFVVNGDKLLVSANIIAYESNSSKIKLNDAEFDFNIQEKTNNELTITNLTFNSGKNGVEKISDNTYNLTIINGIDALLIDYAGKEDTDIVFTRKVVDGVLTGYGVTGLDTAKGGKYFMYYPMGWANTEEKYNDAREAKNGKTLSYDFLVAGKGVAKLNFTYNIAEYSADNA